MKEIVYFDRLTQKEEIEHVYGEASLRLLYATSGIARWVSYLLLPLVAKSAWASRLYGFLQKSRWSRCKIEPFIRIFQVDPTEFLDPVETFCSFNDFFIRKLKKEARPFLNDPRQLVMPADGRYLVFPKISASSGFVVKGEKFRLNELLQDAALARRFEEGSMVMARLCPTDYHRFHFPCDGVPGEPRLINGYLFSVNPLAIRQNIHIFSQNKRVVTSIQTEQFGEILYIEIGATSVGSIHQTFCPHQRCKKGDEKGYFSFGGSSLILLFEPGRIVFDEDLVTRSAKHQEVRGLFGQSLGHN